MSNVFVYNHLPCTDGLAAAAILYQKYPDAFYGGLKAGQDKAEEEELVKTITDGAQVFFLDVVPSEGTLRAICAKPGVEVTIYDHHQTNEKMIKNMQEVPQNLTIFFDMSKCATEMVAEKFGVDEAHTKLVELIAIQDRYLYLKTGNPDLERDAKAFNAGFRELAWNQSHKHNPNVFTAFFSLDVNKVIQDGRKLLEADEEHVKKLVENHDGIRDFTIKVGDAQVTYRVMYKRISPGDVRHTSDIGNGLAQKMIELAPGAVACGAVLYDSNKTPGATAVSFRSFKPVDCTPLAQFLDPRGGGHAQACGCESSVFDE